MNTKVIGFCQEASWSCLSLSRKELQYFLKHRLKMPRYFYELDHQLRNDGSYRNQRCYLPQITAKLASEQFLNRMVDDLDTEILKVKKNASTIKCALIVWRMQYMTDEKVERVVQAYNQHEREGQVRLNLQSVNCLLKNARLVISKEVFELWCEKSMALLKKDGIIGIDEFLYLAPNSIEIEDYVRKLARRSQNKGITKVCKSTETLTQNLVKNLSKDFEGKVLEYEGKEASKKEVLLQNKFRQAMENQSLEPTILQELLQGMKCTVELNYDFGKKEHQKRLLNGYYVREEIEQELRTGKAVIKTLDKASRKSSTQPSPTPLRELNRNTFVRQPAYFPLPATPKEPIRKQSIKRLMNILKVELKNLTSN